MEQSHDLRCLILAYSHLGDANELGDIAKHVKNYIEIRKGVKLIKEKI